MTIEARVTENVAVGGIDAYIVMTSDGARFVLADGGTGGYDWVRAEAGVPPPPTIRLDDDAARALLEALTRHYSGAADLRTLRADLLHERQRADNLINAVLEIAQVGIRK